MCLCITVANHAVFILFSLVVLSLIKQYFSCWKPQETWKVQILILWSWSQVTARLRQVQPGRSVRAHLCLVCGELLGWRYVWGQMMWETCVLPIIWAGKKCVSNKDNSMSLRCCFIRQVYSFEVPFSINYY